MVFGQKKVVGSIVGGCSDMAEMLAFAAEKKVRLGAGDSRLFALGSMSDQAPTGSVCVGEGHGL